MTNSIRTCLWFDGNGAEAAEFYVSLLPGSAIETIFSPDPTAPPLVVNFNLSGVPYQILNGGPHYTLSPAASISVTTPDQSETDRLWFALLEGGGQASRCAWLTDKFGLSWQIVPEVLPRLLSVPDKAAAERVMQAMLQMRKIEIETLESAYRGDL